jgi:hypothetical protein
MRKESAFIHWNDILYCDANANGDFSFVYSSESSAYVTVDEPYQNTTRWYFVEPQARLPRVPTADCYVLSQQDVCPPLLANVENASCKYQQQRSGTFKLINRDTI